MSEVGERQGPKRVFLSCAVRGAEVGWYWTSSQVIMCDSATSSSAASEPWRWIPLGVMVTCNVSFEHFGPRSFVRYNDGNLTQGPLRGFGVELKSWASFPSGTCLSTRLKDGSEGKGSFSRDPQRRRKRVRFPEVWCPFRFPFSSHVLTTPDVLQAGVAS